MAVTQLSPTPVPRLIHQMWRDTEVPEKWRAYAKSWQSSHPGFEYHLWTDLELRRLIREEYPWFVAIYDHYPEPIQRADAARYFLMHRFGGIYADLDYECLRPFDELLGKYELVFGYEPAEHLEKAVVKEHGLTHVVGNALLVSCPGHPFWEHLFLELIGAHRKKGPLASTGPFLLTRALGNFPGKASVSCLPSRLLYPGTSDEASSGLLNDPAWRRERTDSAYGIHHWNGSWISTELRDPRNTDSTRLIPAVISVRGKAAVQGAILFKSEAALACPLVSCLMVTRSSRLPFIRRAVACFQAQSYQNAELVIVDDGTGNEIVNELISLRNMRIRYIRAAAQDQPLGALRNLSVTYARGQYVAQWDDDDLYHPDRIQNQLEAIHSSGADACLLSRWRIWWPASERLAISKKRAWEGSLLCRKDRLPPYDESLAKGEDTPAVLKLASREKVVFLDAPWLYTYVVHGENTTPSAEIDQHWSQATAFYWGDSYPDAIRSLVHEFQEPARTLIEEFSKKNPITLEKRERREEKRPLRVSSPERKKSVAPPSVLVLTPVKDGALFIESYGAGLERLSYPRERLSIAVLESDSVDGTYPRLSEKLKELTHRFSRSVLLKRDFHLRLEGERSASAFQLIRRSTIAKSRNYLLSKALRDEDFVLWLDFDVIDYPDDLIERLISKEKDILVPHCVIAPGGRTFDLNTFIKTSSHLEPGSPGAALLQPPKGVGRKYLEEMRHLDLVEVDSVGGTALLVRADLHREGLIFPAAPYKGYIETEGLSFLARDLGIRSWAAPKIEVIHACH